MPNPYRTPADLDKYRELESMLPKTYPRLPIPEEDKRWIELLAKLDGITRGLNALLKSREYVKENGIWRKPCE